MHAVVMSVPLKNQMAFPRQPTDAHDDQVPRLIQSGGQLGQRHRVIVMVVEVLPNIACNKPNFCNHGQVPCDVIAKAGVFPSAT